MQRRLASRLDYQIGLDKAVVKKNDKSRGVVMNLEPLWRFAVFEIDDVATVCSSIECIM